jgi:hypothetical protein
MSDRKVFGFGGIFMSNTIRESTTVDRNGSALSCAASDAIAMKIRLYLSSKWPRPISLLDKMAACSLGAM